jgi:hypothetical protein
MDNEDIMADLDIVDKEKIAELYEKEPRPLYLLFNRVMIEKHLERLMEQRRVVQEEGGFCRACG